MTAPRNPWIMTASGRAFDLVEPTAAMVHWPDVAEHLAKTPRFAGATTGVHYSVAQHSVLVAHLAGPTWAPWALLHDAHEAWLGDATTPLKAAMARVIAGLCELAHTGKIRHLRDVLSQALPSSAWRAAEHILLNAERPDFAAAVSRGLETMRARIDAAVWSAAGLGVPCDACRTAIKKADLIALATERRDLMPKGLDADWDFPLPKPDSTRIRALPWPRAQAQFDAEFARLFPHLQTRTAA